MILFGALDELDRRQLAFALDLLAHRLRADRLPLTPNLAALLDLITATDPRRPEPSILATPEEVPDDDLVLLDIDEVAHRLRTHRRTVERAIAEGRLTPTRIGRAVRVHRGDLADFIAASRGAMGHGRRA